MLDPIQGYSTCGTYHFLTASDEFLDRVAIIKCGTSMFLPRFLFLLDDYFKNVFLQRLIWRVGECFNLTISCALADVTVPRWWTTFFLHVTASVTFGICCGSGSTFLMLPPVWLVNILISLLIWQVYAVIFTFFLQGNLACLCVGNLERKEWPCFKKCGFQSFCSHW